MTQVRVLSTKAVVLTGVALLVIGVGLAIWFVLAYGGHDNQLEAIKTAGTFVVGGGGAAALYLTARRQRSNEMALQQKELDQQQADRTYTLQERVAAATEAESQQRRITESYGAALEQLGSDKPAVRLGSLYALERLAQDNPAQRQMIVNVICAYLRMAPETPSPQENEVRRTAQRFLGAHLRPAEPGQFWAGIELDLSEAVLDSFDLRACEVGTATFHGTEFLGSTSFEYCRFTGTAHFDNASFQGVADFHAAGFAGEASFIDTEFGYTTFRQARFAVVRFTRATFRADVRFSNAEFTVSAAFNRAVFHQGASLVSAVFADPPDLTRALARGTVDGEWPRGWRTAPLDETDKVPEGGDPSQWRRLVRQD
ncbi:pentapeptide repeat protein [Labedaea rhizosphaerae]|uniref:Pentapeptide repeat protein n=1 Tax=Labedaea rhizosphaerae TaxID=598644 RepID=A0A4R6SLE2_LABRH|nr:pentapeptide repeat protein [Labedaea rhizosphaerae]